MTEKNNSFNWKESVSLKEYFEARIAALEQATEMARVAMEKRLDAMNEFRESLRDQQANSPTRAEVEAKLAPIERSLQAFNVFREERAGVPEQIKNLQTDVKELRTFRDQQQGSVKAEDLNRVNTRANIGMAVGIIGVLMAIITFLINNL